ncbi:MAG: RNA methyltransferase [Candidatus Promineifilaceae bacterium]|nr:RNA methyltransferase [Candidatus Promineifilaceae bacterium]
MDLELETDVKEEVIAYLSQFVTAPRRRRMDKVLAWRTRHLTVALEDVYQPHNASAVLRSCEIFGVQDVHVVEGTNRFRPNKDVALGASQWLTLRHYRGDAGESTACCLRQLKARGYRIAATTLQEDATALSDLSLDRPLALVFGTEEEGLSQEAHELADTFLQLPMFGFTQSFNVSVTVALCLYDLTRRLRASEVPWQLSDQEKRDLKLKWLIRSTERGELLVRRFLREREEGG